MRLPKHEELESLLRRKLIIPIEGHREWLEGRVDPSHALYAEVIAGAPVKKTAKSNDRAHLAAFRAVIEYGVQGSKLEPWNSKAAPRGR